MSTIFQQSAELEHAAQALRSVRRVVFLTGAGISAESGIPTFRDPQTGLWARYAAAALATPQAFDRDPALVWGWYQWRRARVRAAQPNAGHRAIATLAQRIPELTLVTQNVDDLHERAGSKGVIHLHGELARSKCAECGREPRSLASEDSGLADSDLARAHEDEPARVHAPPDEGTTGPVGSGTTGPTGPTGPIEPPRCRDCGGYLRPGVVWFGESLPPEAWRSATIAAGRSELFFCCGTSSQVQPAASLTSLAAAAGAMTVQINPNETGLEASVSIALRGKAGEVLPALLAAAWGPGG